MAIDQAGVFVTRTNQLIVDAIADLPDKSVVGAYDQLKPSERLFVDHYLSTDNALRSYIAVYPQSVDYERSTIRVRVYELFKSPMVQAAIADRLRQQRERLEISADWVVREIAKLAAANISDYYRKDEDGNIVLDENGLPTFDFSGVTREQYAALSEMIEEQRTENRGNTTVRTVKLKTSGKVAALDMLMKRFGMYAPERHDHKVSGQIDTNVEMKAVHVHMTAEDAAAMYAEQLSEEFEV